MITFKTIVISTNRRKDGTYPVKIRVTFKGKTRRLPTTMVCSANDLTRSLKIKNPDILNKGDELIGRMRKAVKDISPFDLENKDVDWVVSRIKETLSGEDFRLDFFDWADRFILTKSESTRLNYATALNAFEDFIGKREIDINAISRPLLLDFVDFVDNSPKKHYSISKKMVVETTKEKVARGASTRYITHLQHIFNSAKDRYNDEDEDRILIPRSPFAKIEKVYPPNKGQKSLGVELMQRLISDKSTDPSIRIAVDIFVVSFGLMGANLVDLYNASPVKDVWVYNRIKTKTRRADRAEMRVTIPPELAPFILRCQGRRGKWWLSSLHELADTSNICTTKVNTALKRWCRQNDVPEFTFYAARHTWATLARKSGVEKATVDEGLAHKGDFAITDIYAERDWDLINEANRKVLALFEW